MITMQELKDKLLQTYDPNDLVELLNISSEELVNRFEDFLDGRFGQLCEEFEEDEED